MISVKGYELSIAYDIHFFPEDSIMWNRFCSSDLPNVDLNNGRLIFTFCNLHKFISFCHFREIWSSLKWLSAIFNFKFEMLESDYISSECRQAGPQTSLKQRERERLAINSVICVESSVASDVLSSLPWPCPVYPVIYNKGLQFDISHLWTKPCSSPSLSLCLSEFKLKREDFEVFFHSYYLCVVCLACHWIDIGTW